jgi:hypothetical protein
LPKETKDGERKVGPDLGQSGKAATTEIGGGDHHEIQEKSAGALDHGRARNDTERGLYVAVLSVLICGLLLLFSFFSATGRSIRTLRRKASAIVDGGTAAGRWAIKGFRAESASQLSAFCSQCHV